jgi:hypothetical protein
VPIGRWYEIVGDPTLAEAVLDRVVHAAHRIELKGESLRKLRASAWPWLPDHDMSKIDLRGWSGLAAIRLEWWPRWDWNGWPPSSESAGNEASRRLAKIPGVGPITASAVVATIGDASSFTSARHLSAAWGLTPKQNSSGGKAKQGGISKAGNIYLRRLLFLGAIAVIRSKRTQDAGGWLARLLERRPAKVVAIAVANKTARVIWAMLRSGDAYRAPKLAGAMPAAA